MRIISKKSLRTFTNAHQSSKLVLDTWWYRITKKADSSSYDDVKKVFGKRIDQAGKFVVFDIGGNKYRLIAVIRYKTQIVFIRKVLTHAEYSTNRWKNQ
jgi:mRNA interferase HigB